MGRKMQGFPLEFKIIIRYSLFIIHFDKNERS